MKRRTSRTPAELENLRQIRRMIEDKLTPFIIAEKETADELRKYLGDGLWKEARRRKVILLFP